MRKIRWTWIAGIAIAVAGMLAVTAPASPASASPVSTYTAPAVPAGVTTLDQTCPYPYVCFYNSSGTITGRFQDVTSGWQWLSASRGAAYARNTRHDDTAFYHFTDGRTYCAAPLETTIFFATVDAIRISSSSSCP